MSINLNDLVPAKTAPMLEHEAKEHLYRPRHNLRHSRGEVRARLLAQEYVRNGQKLGAAMATIGIRSTDGSIGRLAVWQQDIFFDELQRLIARSDIERDRALQIMWTMVNTSILDFIDENGRMMEIKELKRLPRLVQLVISKIKIKRIQQEIKDKDGHLVLDDHGSPYLKTTEIVELEVPERLAAMNQLAQLMKWTGPIVQVNNFNIGRHMMDADMRAEQAKVIYEAAERQLLSKER